MELPSYLKHEADLYRTAPRAAAAQWFRNARFGLFIHYGLYSLGGRGERTQVLDLVPVNEYAKLTAKFTASDFDAEYLADLAVDAGMAYINFTARHYDGFSLFDTQQSSFNSCQSAAKRDLVAEMARACERRGLGLNLCYAHGRDWHHPHSPRDYASMARPAYDPPDPAYAGDDEYDMAVYLAFMKAQLEELLGNYGPIAAIWLHGLSVLLTGDRKVFDCDGLYDYIRELQPQVLVAYQQGLTGAEDFYAPEQRPIHRPGGKPMEICTPLAPNSWGYVAAEDGLHKSADEVWGLLASAQRGHCNLLLNTGLLPNGRVCAEDEKTLRAVGQRIRDEGFPSE